MAALLRHSFEVVCYEAFGDGNKNWRNYGGAALTESFRMCHCAWNWVTDRAGKMVKGLLAKTGQMTSDC